MDIASLKPYSRRVELTVKVISKNEPREVTSRLDSSTHKVTEALVGDSSGAILLTLWDDLIEKIEDGKSYKIANAYTSLFKNSLRLNIGRYGTIEETTEEVAEVNQENNLSEKTFEQRRGSFGGRRDFGSRGGFNREYGKKPSYEEDSSEEEME